MKKAFFLLLIVFGTASCASELLVLSKNPAHVTFRFKTESGKSVLTFWRRIDPGGYKTKRFSVGVSKRILVMNAPFPSYEPDTLLLDAGFYYLDSYQVPLNGEGNSCYSERGHFNTRNGWDDEIDMPHYLAFTVREGENLTLPEVVFNGECKAEFRNADEVFTVGERWKNSEI